MKSTTLVLGCALSASVALASDAPVTRSGLPERTVRTTNAKLEAEGLAAVREADLRAAFPELRPESRLRRACLDFDPGKAKAFFSPFAVGERLSETPRVACEDADRRISCEMSLVPTYFVENPAKSFEIDEGLELGEAVAVVGLFEQGAWTADREDAESDAERPGQRVFKISKLRNEYVLTIRSSDCGGCDGFLHVKPVFQGSRMVGLHTDSDLPAAGCIMPPPDWLSSQDGGVQKLQK